jgi:hypothetical protein
VGKLGESGEYRMRRSVCGLVHEFGAPKVVATPVLIKARIGFVRTNKL